MKSILNFFVCCLLTSMLTAQSDMPLPEHKIDGKEIQTQLEFLASDFLKGRRTGAMGNQVAAEYIAAHLKAYGYQTVEGASGYYQKLPLVNAIPPRMTELRIGEKNLLSGDDYIVMSSPKSATKGTAVFAGHGWIDKATDHNDYKGLEVKDKIVFVWGGAPGKKDPESVSEAMEQKKKWAAERGAKALYEIYQLPFPWDAFVSYFGGESIKFVSQPYTDDKLTYGWVNIKDEALLASITTGEKLLVASSSSASSMVKLDCANVLGVLPGSDPVLKNEYLLLSAHYDHVGVGAQGGRYTAQDSIFNGARDNGIGVVALLAAAKSLAHNPPARSVIIMAVNAEEMGLLGSKYYADHPLIPLDQVVFNLNTDGAGYTDTTAVAVLGWDRTGTNDLLEQSAKDFGLEVIKNPVPEMQLFDRSDNASFAAKGVPCVSYSPGFSEFSPELMKNYHQVSDETHDLDWRYIKKYSQAFARAARLIADAPVRPQWVAGDKYEAAAKALYGDR